MAEEMSARNVVNSIANNSLSELCLICLSPLNDITFESIFTTICKEKQEYSVAAALEAVCQFKFDGTEHYNVCIQCFKFASLAYTFHLKAKRSMEILTHYTEGLLDNIQNVDVSHTDAQKILCIPLTDYVPEILPFDFNLDAIGQTHIEYDDENDNLDSDTKEEKLLLVVKNKINSNSELDVSVKHESDSDDEEMLVIINEKKERKKRDPLSYMSCSKCPIKYRFVMKLKEHMKNVHNVEIYYCKICKITTENKDDYEEHLKKHDGKHQCTICNAVYKKHKTLVTHMKLHEKEKEQPEQCENANICEICGALLENERSLQDHVASRHVKRFTCYYCGRMYKGQAGFEIHIKKHEAIWNKKYGSKIDPSKSKPVEEEAVPQDKSKRCVCHTCGKDFVDERALMWHQRLHNNERPFTCEVCSRAFVSKNRRNQHQVCAHTPPTRRCPLCPKLFHLRSMVNTHLKQVHLKAHKRRTRAAKPQNVFWRTAPVPIQELSVAVQHDVLELQCVEGQTQNQPQSPAASSLLYM